MCIAPEFTETWIFAILCSFIHASINSKCTTRRASRIEARRRRAWEKCTAREEKRSGGETKGRGGRKERNSPGSSYFLGVQRSLYGQAIFMTKPPGRAEVTRKVTRYFRHVTRRYSYSSPGKWLVKALRAINTQGHPWPYNRLRVTGESVNHNGHLFEDEILSLMSLILLGFYEVKE